MTSPTDNASTEFEPFERAYATRQASASDGWLRAIRENAMQAFLESGFPTVRDEDWKYTNLRDVASRSAAYLNNIPPRPDVRKFERLLRDLPIHPDAYSIVFANGKYCDELSRLPGDAAGLSIDTLQGLDDRSKTITQGLLGKYAPVESLQLTALNTAFMDDGLIIRLSENAKIEAPIHAIFIGDDREFSIQPRILIHLESACRASFVEHYVGHGASCTNAVTEIHCADGAHLRYVKIQQEHPEAFHLASQHIQLDRDARFEAVHVDLGAGLARNDLTVRLAGPGASTQIDGLFVVDGERHVDNHTRLDHIEGHTTSVENYRGIINDRGRGVFNGKIIVQPGADKTDAQLNNRNLLLSSGAEIDTKPELEIYTDDVKCAHGTTTGQLDEDALFYLRARGIPENRAKQMLVTAFAREIIDRIDSTPSPLTDHVTNAVMQHLPG